MELLKDYDRTILYHLSKANIVADALSRKSIGSLAHIAVMRRPLVEEIHKLEAEGVHFKLGGLGLLLAHIRAQSSLIEQTKAVQYKDPKLCKMGRDIYNGKKSELSLDQAGVLRCGNQLFVPKVGNLRRTLLEQAHNSRYTIHPSSTKMYQDLKQLFWWGGMKWDIRDFVSHCLVCQQVKAEHQDPPGYYNKLKYLSGNERELSWTS